MTDQIISPMASVSHISLMNRPYGPRIHMDENASSAPAGPEPAPVIAPANLDSTDTYSPEQAFEAYQKKANPPAESADTATADTKSADEADAAPPEEATSETQEDDQPEKAPLDLPRSWTKDRAEHWAKLDPDTQEFLLEQDRKASAEVRRVQNEAAEKLKGLTAKEQQAEQARQSFEARQADYTKALETALQSDFGDIQTLNDVRKMQAEDPFRFQAWQVRQMELSAAQAEKQQVDQRKSQEHQTQWTDHVHAENAKAAEIIPDLADEKKGPALQKRAAQRLGELGFKPEELNDLASGKTKLSIYDHRLQQLIFSDLKLSDIQKAKAAAIPIPVPSVQRPGVAPPKGAAAAESVQALRNKLAGTGSVDDAFALYQAKQRRRS